MACADGECEVNSVHDSHNFLCQLSTFAFHIIRMASWQVIYCSFAWKNSGKTKLKLIRFVTLNVRELFSHEFLFAEEFL